MSNKNNLTAEERLNLAAGIIKELAIKNEDLKQDIYLRALETELPENTKDIMKASAELGLDRVHTEYVLLKESIMSGIVDSIRRKKKFERHEDPQGLIGTRRCDEGSQYDVVDDDINLLLAMFIAEQL